MGEKRVTRTLCLLGDFPQLFVPLHAVEEVLLAARWLNVFDTDMDPLLHNSVSHLLVDFNADRSLGNIPNNPGPALVESVRHALVDGTVDFDVHVVPEFVGCEVFGERGQAMSSEGLRERVPGSGTITEGVRHGAAEEGCRCKKDEVLMSTLRR